MNREENAIYQGIESIAYCNSKIGEELYELSLKCVQDDTYLSILKQILNQTSVDSRQLDILIKLNFFSDFGENQYILDATNIYRDIASRKIFKKVELGKLGIDEALMKKYANKETPKQFSEVDTIGLVQELIKDIPNKPLPVGEQLKAEKEYLGYCSTTYNTLSDNLYIVIDYTTYKDATHPYIVVRNLSTGEEIKTDVKSKFYKARPFGEWSILKISHFDYEFKKKLVDGKWISTDQQKITLESYEVIKREK
jgi:DNA polymerase-3 subunit alpha